MLSPGKLAAADTNGTAITGFLFSIFYILTAAAAMTYYRRRIAGRPWDLVVWLVSSLGVHGDQAARAWGWVLPCASIRRSRSLRSVRVNLQVNGRAMWL